ncbi:hypothetical protein BKI52_04730 [marine bacterium AO1-C]|nr:hypothetical protein BKI52_04730 [marine bacterium AO1-C]
MKKTALVLTFLVISLISYGQKKVNVPGTRVWMALPEGASLGKNFTGVQMNKSTVIFVMEQKGKNFYSNTKDFKESYAQIPDLKVIDYQEFKIGQYPAKFIWVQSNSQKKAYQLVFGDSTFSVTIVSSYALENEEMGKKIKKVILTVQYERDQKINPYNNSVFSLDDAHSRLKFYRFPVSNDKFFMYTLNGKEMNLDEPRLSVTLMPTDALQTPPEEILQSIFEKEKENKVGISKVSNIDKIVNGYQAHELIIKSKSTQGKDLYSFIQLISNNRYQVLVQGSRLVDRKFDPKIFTELTNTIHFKK